MTQEVGPPITDEATLRLWAIYDEHAQVDGRCRLCGTMRSCPDRTYAYERLIMSDRWHQPRPDDRPHETAGDDDQRSPA